MKGLGVTRVYAAGILAVLAPISLARAQTNDIVVPDQLVPVPGRASLAAIASGLNVELVAPRGGYASASATLNSAASNTIAAAVSDLVGPGGSVAGSNLVLRFARRAEPEPLAFKLLASGSDMSVTTPYYDELHASPAREDAADAVTPVWLTARVPRETPAGVYTGTLTIAAAAVPVRLTVAAWICPPPREWQTHVGVMSSPETLAKRYKIELWSEAHWALIAEQMGFLAGIGNDDLWLSVFSRNAMGHERSWIAYTRDGDALKPDLRTVRRYAELYSRIVGKPHAVLLEIWNSARCRARPGRPPPAGVEVWVDGKPETVPIPGADGSEKVWAPLLNDLRAMLREIGWSENLLVLGCADDIRPDIKTVRAMQQWAPAAKWAFWTHGRGDPPPWDGKWIIAGMEVGHYEHLFCPSVGEDRPDGITGGWDMEFREYATCRNYLPKYAPPSQYRSLPEGTVVHIGRTSSNMTRSGSGFTRIALDFWPVEIGDGVQEETRSLLLFYEPSPWDIFFRNNSRSIVAPGTNGPVSTVRYEMLREGLQECEARIGIEQALAGGKVKGDLERRCRDLLRRRLKTREADGRFKGGHAGDTIGAAENRWGVPPDWRASALELFNLAAECQHPRGQK
jgi:hypothetical protein